jgi:ParB family protein of integrating conjugative element (PFGI_1 class)
MTLVRGADARARQVAQSLRVGNPGNNAADLPSALNPGEECQIDIAIEDIRAYEYNPRREANQRFDDIKESIRTGGLRTPLTVTQRPGDGHYIVESGGNTRLLALHQLWTETRDPRFARLRVVFRPWRSETHVLAAHLIENEQRGDMSFWDRATGFAALKQRLEAEQGRSLSLRALDDVLHERGLTINTATLGLYLFATERLRPLGELVPGLSGLDVKTLQPRLNALRKLAQARTGIDEAQLYSEVFTPAFRASARDFSVGATLDACEHALASLLGEPVEAVRAELGRSRASPSAAAVASPSTGSAPGSASTDDLMRGIQGFAHAAGLDSVLRVEPGTRYGYRLARIRGADRLPLPRQRALAVLAVVTGEDPADHLPLPDSAELLAWLTDPVDEAAEAFCRLLPSLRHQPGTPITSGGHGRA